MTPGSSRCRDDEALFLSSREAQWVPIPQVRKVEVSQELLPGLTTRFGCPDCEFSGKCVGKELSPSVLHDERARGFRAERVGRVPAALRDTRRLGVSGSRPGSR